MGLKVKEIKLRKEIEELFLKPIPFSMNGMVTIELK